MSEILADKKLIQQYLAGDEKSLEILIKRYLKPIYGFVYKNVGNATDAEDITQDVFVKIWKNIKKFDQSKEFKPWIFQIAKNASIDFLRKKKSIPFSKFENDKGFNALISNMAAAPFNLLEVLNNKGVLAAATEGLPVEYKRVITLYHNDGLNFREISELFSQPINTVKSRYRRAIATLRKNIKV